MSRAQFRAWGRQPEELRKEPSKRNAGANPQGHAEQGAAPFPSSKAGNDPSSWNLGRTLGKSSLCNLKY